jgi:iron complex transport system substrate-binding protein
MKAIKFLLIFLLVAGSLTAGCLSDYAGESGKDIKTVKDIKNYASSDSNLSKAVSESLSEFPLTVRDDFGSLVTIERPPERIVSLAPSNTENLFALGLGSKIIGVTDYCNYPPEAKKKTKVGGYSTINIEKVVSLKPDLVVASYGNGKQNVDVMRDLGLTVIAFNPKKLEDVKENIILLGKITGTGKKAQEIVMMMDEKINKIKLEYKSRPRVAHILWHDPIWVSGGDTFIDELIYLAGGENVFSGLDGWKIVSKEDLLQKNPDVILVSSGSGMGGQGKDLIYEWVMTELGDVKAVKENRVYVVDADIISRPSYRLVYALEDIAKILHPEIFGK